MSVKETKCWTQLVRHLYKEEWKQYDNEALRDTVKSDL